MFRRGVVALLLPLAAVVLLLPGGSIAGSTRSAASTGSWFWGTADHTLATVQLIVDTAVCGVIVAPEAQGITIEGVTGAITVSTQTPVPRAGDVALLANPALGPNGTLQFTLQTNVALPTGTVISIQIYPDCSGPSGEQVNATQVSPTPPPPPPPSPLPPPPVKETPHLDKAAGKIEQAIVLERRADSAYAAGATPI